MIKFYLIKIVTCLLIITFSSLTKAQNLVTNWSFEDTVNCPFLIGQMNLSIGWNSYRNTPDFFHSCSSNQTVGVPENYFDFQPARTGNAYGGFLAFSTFATNAREVLGSQLNQPLVIGTKYYAKFFVSRVSKSFALGIDVSVDKIGIHLSTMPLAISNQSTINNVSQVFSTTIITDTLNWTEISGSFVADSNYQFIYIGNFFQDQFVNFIQTDTINTLSYYFVDDICVSPDSTYCDQLLNINEIENSNLIQVFPNPARDWIVVRGNGIKAIQIYDVSGKLFYLNSLSIDSYTIDLSKFTSGVYFIKVETLGEEYFEKLLIYH